ncbi:MAG TPA: SIR2 family protein [Rudaea sp.]|jgi:tetratricopeptide (TPR) repeat protein
MTIDANLVEEVRAGNVVLFLGAGASLGAKDSKGHSMPSTDDLKKKICGNFLDDSYAGLDFVQTCDYATTAKGGRKLQEFIHNALYGFEPAEFHKRIPTFHWAGIATTNFDLIVERAYRDVTDRLQRVRPLLCDTPDFMDSLEKGDLLYLKLHGCITAFDQLAPGMVYSTERILRHKEGRAAQFAQFLEWAKRYTLVFAGYSLRDYNLRLLIDEIVKDGDSRPRHYIVKKGTLEIESLYWSERRFTLIDSSLEQFLVSLEGLIPTNVRRLGVLRSPTATSLTRFIASHRQESSALRNYLQSGAEHVTTETKASEGTARKFFSGFDLGWYPIEHDIDFDRPTTRSVLEEQVALTETSTGPRLVVLKAHAGAGKSVALRRIAWDAAKKLSKLVVFVSNTGYINVQALLELISLTNEALLVVIEDITLVAERVYELIVEAKRKKSPIIVIGGARFNEWNVYAQVLETSVTAEYEMKYLSPREIDDLLVQLELNDCLDELKELDPEGRVKQFTEVYGRQLLVALHEATRGAHFPDIIYDEFQKIPTPEARILYADICALHRFGSPVRAGLISRVHGIDFNEFGQRFLRPLEQVVSLVKDERSGDWIYTARHPYIAEMLYLQVFKSQAERFDNHIKLISRLNPAYSYDRRIIGELLRGNALAEAFPDVTKGLAIFEVAVGALGDQPHIYHQKGIYLKRLAGDVVALQAAESALLRARELAPADRTIRHSLAELALARARHSANSIERAAWRTEAISIARSLLATSNGSYAYHTIAKAQLQALSDAMDKDDDDTLTADVVSESIKAAEEAVRVGLQRFPGDAHLLSEEAALAQLLENDERAERALRRAFDANKRSQLIAKRYAVVLRARNKLPEAREVLRQALEHNPGSQDLNFDFAELTRLMNPALDSSEPEQLLSYYLRAFTKGDKNYRAQLLCARQLTLAGRESEARQLFEHLKNAAVPFNIKSQVKEVVRRDNGDIRRFNGSVAARRDSYGFIVLAGC